MTESASRKKIFLLALGALGVVYGDIGTSPLYAIKEIFFGHALHTYTSSDVFGAISLVFWAVTLIISVKYIVFVLRADSDGEGGVFALYSLLSQVGKKMYVPFLLLLVIASGLLLGDGIITPAISVISSVEGVTLITDRFTPYVIPITVGILTLLFLIQSKGTAKVGRVFGPVMLVWFITIAFLGLGQIVQFPAILQAVNPLYGISFLTHHSLYTILLLLGSVMLVITGGEAMYADMGHFGRLPIRVSWFAVAYPALLLNYFGQGAYLLSGQEVINENIFFSMVPSIALIPTVVLATLATVIASQALISGAFSLATQAVSLGLFPYLSIKHTHEEHEGQVYIPFINWMLYVGAVALVIVFRSSSNLAATYGLAVSGDMLVTAIAMIIVTREYWKWKLPLSLLVFLPFLFIDGIFFFANSLKLLQGGYIPVYIALSIFVLIRTWQWGRERVVKTYKAVDVGVVQDLISLKQKKHASIPRAMIIMTPQTVSSGEDKIPLTSHIFYERYGVLPQHIIFLTVNLEKIPHAKKERYSVVKLFDDKEKGSITSVVVNFGFMEDPNVEKTLRGMAKLKEVPLPDDYSDWQIHVVHEKILPGNFRSIWKRIHFELYKFIHRNTDTADHYFGLGVNHSLTIEVVPVRLR